MLQTEYEATFSPINEEEVRKKIQSLGGKCIRKKYNQKRTVFNLPKGHEIDGGYIRVRDEGNRITMTMKIMKSDGTIEGQKEIEIIVDNYDNAVEILKNLGAEEKAVQETKREIWKIEEVELMIDWWPFLDPVLEIEGKTEQEVRKISKKLGFNWNNAIFDSIDYVYSQKYSISTDRINNHTPKIVFDMENPFIDSK